jgi:hypothetical protein
MPPVLIRTPFLKPKEVARILGVSKSRLKWLQGLVQIGKPAASSPDAKASRRKTEGKVTSSKRADARKSRASAKRRRGGKAAR